MQGVCDAAFACHIDDRRSQGGYVFLMGGAAVSWKSYTISTVARSTRELENVAASDAGAETIFLRNFLGEPGFPQQSATSNFTDSTSAEAIINNPCNRARTKHIEINYYTCGSTWRQVDSISEGQVVGEHHLRSDKTAPRAAHSYNSFMMGLDVEASKAFDLLPLQRDSRSCRKGSSPA